MKVNKTEYIKLLKELNENEKFLSDEDNDKFMKYKAYISDHFYCNGFIWST